MSDVFTNPYWTTQFQVTQGDLDRIAARIRGTRRARDLTSLARRLVRGRLRHGQETSNRVPLVWAQDPSVRLWDPVDDWDVSDHVIVLTWSYARKRKEPMVGEVVRTQDMVTVLVDDTYRPERPFQRAGEGTEEAQKWRETVENAVAGLRGSDALEERIDLVVLEHGERVVGQLLEAMRSDGRFVRLAGRWFLRDLAKRPSVKQIDTLAWRMVELDEAQPTGNLVAEVKPPLTEGDAGLFGLYLALRERADLFANADPGQRPRWVLAGPPPGGFTPYRAAFDPETYEVLCMPTETAPPEVVGRLWEADLLQAVM